MSQFIDLLFRKLNDPQMFRPSLETRAPSAHLPRSRHRVFNRGFEFFEVYGFHQMFRKACLDTVLNVAVHPEAADRDAWYSRFCVQTGMSSKPLPSGRPTSLIRRSNWSRSATSIAECMSCVVATV